MPFDGGVAHIEPDGYGMERVVLRDSGGTVLAESRCDTPLESYDAARAFFTDVRGAIESGDVARAATFMTFQLRISGVQTRIVASREQVMSEHPGILTGDLSPEFEPRPRSGILQ